MGRKGWFRSMKKAMGSDSSKDQNDEGGPPSKSKKKWFGKKKAAAREEEGGQAATEQPPIASPQPPPPPSPPPPPEPIPNEVEKIPKQHTSSIAIATAKAAEAAIAAAQAAAELARLTNTPTNRFPGKSKEEAAAIRIQTAFRGYTARRALRVLRGLARLKTLMQGPSVKRQTTNALRCMQTLVRVQYEIQARRLRTTEENQARQRQLLQKHGKELHKLQNLEQNEDEWNASFKTKEQIQARVQSKHDAAIRRERALAYSFNHQRTWRNSTTTKTAQTMFVEASNPHWGWSWLERWLAAKPWESAAPANPDLAPLNPSPSPSGSQIAKALLYHVKEQSATSSPRSSLHSPRSATAPRQRSSVGTGRLSTSSTPTPRARGRAPKRRDADTESIASSAAEANTSAAVVPSYMAPTESARARSRMGSPNSADRMSVGSTNNRRVSYPSSPARSRRSTSSVTDANSVDGK